MITVRPLTRDDASTWHELWDVYLRFYRHRLSPDVTAATFDRLCDTSDGMVGLVACDTDLSGEIVGLAHLVVHPSTWSIEPYCYLEDLVVAPSARGRGAGAALIRAVFDLADERGWSNVYWHTQAYNAPARALYDEVAHRTSFVKYER